MCRFGAKGVHWAYWWLPLLSSFDSDSVIVDMLFICCLWMISLFVGILCFFAFISLRKREREVVALAWPSSCYGVAVGYSEYLPRGAVDWSAVCVTVAFPGHTHLLFHILYITRVS